jgi:iron complex outermembrane recepter protein
MNRIPVPSRAVVLLGLTTACLLPAFGQTAAVPATPAPTDDPVTLESYVVQGYRQSLQASLDAKRSASAQVDVITAEDVGKFPDTNVAESLSHIPGITVDHLFGQGEKVSILGTDPALNRTLLNGETIASADWFVLDQPGRTFNYTLLAPEIIGQAEVYKTPEARIDEGSIGGTVILHTRDPLSLRPGTISGSVTELYNDRGKKGDFNGSILYGWHNDAKTLGVVASVQSNREHIRRDGLENFYTDTASSYTGAGSTDAALLAHPDAYVLDYLNTAIFTQTRSRKGGDVGLTFKPEPRLTIEANALYVDAKYNNFNQSLYPSPGDFIAGQNADQATVSGTVVQKVHFTNALTEFDAGYRLAQIKTQAEDAKVAWKGDDWNASVHGGNTEATGGTQNEYFAQFQYIGGFTFDNEGGKHPTFAYDDPKVATTPSAWTPLNFGFGFEDAAPTSDREKYAQADFDAALKGPFNKVLVGVKYRDHTTSHSAYADSPAQPTGITAANFGAGLTPGNFLSGFDVTHDMTTHLTVDPGAVQAWFNAHMAPVAAIPSQLRYQNTWTIEEKIKAAYAQGNFGYAKLSGNVGLRAVQTESDSRGYFVNASTNVATPQTTSKTYDNYLPNLNLAYELNTDLVLRASVAQVIARPNYSDMTSYLSLDDTVHTGQGGNPNLNPYKSTNYDVSLEWYFAKNSILSAQLFYKDIGSYIVQSTDSEKHFNQLTKTTDTYFVTRPNNAGNAKSKGVALAFQQTFANGFGALANYTYVDAEGPGGVDLPFASKHQVNISPFFENKDVTARLTYSWRSDYANFGYFGVGVYNRAYTELDASFGYSLTKNLKLTVDALNLLDEEDYTYYKFPKTNIMAYTYKGGRRLQAGVHFTF